MAGRAIAHAVHNGLVDTLKVLTATSSPVLVNLYLVGDNRILVLVSTALGAIAVGYILRRRKRSEQATVERCGH